MMVATLFGQFDCSSTFAVIVDLEPTSAFTIIQLGIAVEYINTRNYKNKIEMDILWDT